MSHRRGQDHYRVTSPWCARPSPRGATIARWRGAARRSQESPRSEIARARLSGTASRKRHTVTAAGPGGSGSMCRWSCSNLPNGTSTQPSTTGAAQKHEATGYFLTRAYDGPSVISCSLRTSGTYVAGGAEGASGSGEIEAAERAGRALAGQARGWPRHNAGLAIRRPGLAPRRYEPRSGTPVTSHPSHWLQIATERGVYQAVASPIPTCCSFPPRGISHSD